MLRKIAIGISVVAVILVAWQLLVDKPTQTISKQQNSSQSQAAKVTETPNQSSSLIIGDTAAQATIIEYGDFKCPSCGKFHQEAGKQLRDEYVNENKLKIDYRPLAVIGPDSERSAVGAYCAGNQNKFTEYHDGIYNYMWDNYYKSRNFAAEYEDILTVKVLTAQAKSIGLDTLAFENCLKDPAEAKKVADNKISAENIGARGTPTFSINNQVVVGPQPYSVFKSLVELQLR